MILCDTNILIEFYKNNPSIIQELRKIGQNQIAAISQKFLELMEAYTLSHKLSIPDALIAATALIHQLELYTLNLKDFRYIPGLKLHQP